MKLIEDAEPGTARAAGICLDSKEKGFILRGESALKIERRGLRGRDHRRPLEKTLEGARR